MPRLPSGFVLESKKPPTPHALNRLLAYCKEAKHSPKKLHLALERSLCHLSIFDEANGNLVGFVRATTDYGLNVNLWNLLAIPGQNQQQFLAVLVHTALAILRRDVPGCSISVSAPVDTIKALQEQGFLLDPGGIRAMGFRL